MKVLRYTVCNEKKEFITYCINIPCLKNMEKGLERKETFSSFMKQLLIRLDKRLKYVDLHLS